MLLGSTRVSKADGSQALDLQKDALIAAGVAPRHIYEDRASGRRDDRPGLTSCLKALREGDTLVLWKLDRLGRDLRHLVNTVHDLTAQGSGSRSSTNRGRPSIRPPQPASWSSGSSRHSRNSSAS
jgi:DNA invertase Pin-like site-specific DNA recombinase